MTNYNEVISDFKDKITDYDLLSIEPDMQNEILLALLKSACRKFNRICINDLKDRDENGNFNVDLEDDEIDIITEWMVVNWTEPFVYNSDLFGTAISTSSFKQNSPANLLEKVSAVYTKAERRARSLTNEYSFVHGDIANLRPR